MPRMTLPLPPHWGQGLPSACLPLPEQASQMSSPAPGVPGAQRNAFIPLDRRDAMLCIDPGAVEFGLGEDAIDFGKGSEEAIRCEGDIGQVGNDRPVKSGVSCDDLRGDTKVHLH